MSDALYGGHLYMNIDVAIGNFADGVHVGQLSTDDSGNEYRWDGDSWNQISSGGVVLVEQNSTVTVDGTVTADPTGKSYHVLDEADGTDVQVSSGSPALLYSVYVNEALAGGNIILQDDSTAVITIPSGTAAGTLLEFGGMEFDTDLTANAEAALTTGNITIGWRLQ